MKKIFSNILFWLLVAIIIGIVSGLFIGEGGVKGVMVLKQIVGQVIFFLVPLIIIGFIAPSIASMQGNTSKILLFIFAVAYLSTEGAALLAIGMGKVVIPWLDITESASLAALPASVFNLEIAPVMSVMSALVLSIFLGIGVSWIKSVEFTKLLDQFRSIVLLLVKRILIPLLPFYVASNFCLLTYRGFLPQLKIFVLVILVAVIGHYIWLAVLYAVAAIYSGKNSLNVLKKYPRAYFTALGTMSSAASLGVALDCAHSCDLIDDEVADYSVPLFNNIHLCGSVLSVVLFVCAVSQVLYGSMPTVGSMVVFVLILGVIAIGAPGVPGGTIMASIGLITTILVVPGAPGGHLGDSAAAILITMFTIQDCFGSACNLTGDGALTLIVNTYVRRNHTKIS